MYTYAQTITIMDMAARTALNRMMGRADERGTQTGIDLGLWSKFDDDLLNEIVTDSRTRYDKGEDDDYFSAMIDTAYAFMDMRDDECALEETLAVLLESGMRIRELDPEAVFKGAQFVINRARMYAGAPDATHDLDQEIIRELVYAYSESTIATGKPAVTIPEPEPARNPILSLDLFFTPSPQTAFATC